MPLEVPKFKKMATYTVYDEVIELLAKLPPQLLLGFHPSEKAQARLEFLLDKKSENQLSQPENDELEKFFVLEHIVRMAKANVLNHISA